MLPPSEENNLNSAYDFKTFQQRSGNVGAKAVGLELIPPAWTPPYISINLELYKAWSQGSSSSVQTDLVDRIDLFLKVNRDTDVDGFILRSSGTLESIVERGRFKSIILSKNSDSQSVFDAAFEIFRHANSGAHKCDIALVLQVYHNPIVSGHLSNEVRVSPTRNQWVFELEKPNWAVPKGLNSKFALLPDPRTDIQCTNANPTAVLRSVGRWLNNHFGPRVHVEWIVARHRFWVVQVDIEWRELDHGFDPHRDPTSISTRAPDYSASDLFNSYSLGETTPWRKLRNLNDFDYGDRNYPKLFFCTADLISARIATGRKKLEDEIDKLTGGCAVIRTDTTEGSSLSSFNLPRTDTVNGQEAVEWLCTTINQLEKSVTSLENVAFILHAFIPAQAGAWAYADPGMQIASVDSLWGLPDGLQVLPHDSYQVDTIRKTILARSVRFKPRFLSQRPDGSWKYIDVMRSKGRSQSLTSSDIIEIACRTAAIASKLNRPAQIMWFSGVPSNYLVGRNLPWFRASDVAQSTSRSAPLRKPYTVRKIEDLAHFETLQTGNFSIKLDPDAELIRSEKFLGDVIRVALEKGATVEIEGSTLSHTFYRLTNEGVNVVPPSFGRYERQRGRRIFGKLVRDKIPQQIASGGERSIEAKLRLEDMVPALLGKLFEEVREFAHSKGKDDAIGEMADVLEILKSICDYSGIDWKNVEDAQITKRDKRGGFKERRILKETTFVKSENKSSPSDTSEIHIDQLGLPHARTEGIVEFPFSSILGRNSATQFSVGNATFRITLRYESGGFVVSVSGVELNTPAPVQLSLFG